MSKFVLFLTVILGCIFNIQAQSFDVALIPKNLTNDANAVVRLDESTIMINSLSNVVYRVRRVITVLNRANEDITERVVYYDKLRKIKSIRLNIYHANGSLLKSVKESDFKDYSAINNSSLFDDNRVKHYKPSIPAYPVTIEEIVEYKVSQTLAIDEWFPQMDEHVGLEKASYEILKSPDFEINFRSFGIAKPETTKQGKLESIKWTIENVAPVKYEPYSIQPRLRLPSLKVSPVKFSYDGIEGEYTDWKSYGKWVYDKLLKDRNDLSPYTIATIKALVKDCKTQKEAAQLIYEYAQKKNRYISVQVGVGGFQPMKTSEVDALSYGDCKALVNYTASLMQVAGIDATYTEVYAGDEKIDYLKDFASIAQGNHIILCLPFPNDTTWLECTNKDAPFGFLGSFTQGRRALMIKEDGGELVETPTYDWRRNLQERIAHFNLESTGNLSGNIKTSFSGIQYQNREGFQELTPTKKDERVKLYYSDVPDFRALSYRLEKNKSVPQWREYLELTTPHFATKNGQYLLFDLNPVNVLKINLKEVANRKNELYINIGYTDIDSISIKIPEDFKIESLPSSVSESFEFGSYELKSKLEDGHLLTVRKMILKNGIYPAETYHDFLGFYDTVKRFDKSRCVLVIKH